MTRIDPARLTEIFRTLSSPTSGQTTRTKSEKSQTPSASGPPISRSRDMGELRSRIQERLQKLRRETGNFAGEAPVVVIREVLLWEFGEEIINHVDFRHITLGICEAIDSSPPLREKMEQMFKDLNTKV